MNEMFEDRHKIHRQRVGLKILAPWNCNEKNDTIEHLPQGHCLKYRRILLHSTDCAEQNSHSNQKRNFQQVKLSTIAFAFLALGPSAMQEARWIQFGEDIDGEAAADYSGASISLSADGDTLAIGARFNAEIHGLYLKESRIIHE
eukprot:CAMPEP_0172483922 /NCGR_PEP_ID=MMETSP1066-20121228/11153_1 /TAXON_ID=671091 /ORGANISM="Coscinodiscus wailesii, Strain CCMP2513" /LENGTH=144 /DNA_ID=CAMNT_0013248119 /DNA_START=1453 /DNA_END=1888 /DNA_ORIENTATION=+